MHVGDKNRRESKEEDECVCLVIMTASEKTLFKKSFHMFSSAVVVSGCEMRLTPINC